MSTSADVVAREMLDLVPAIMRTIRGEMHNQWSTDLSVHQFRALMFINRRPGCSLLDAARHLGLTPPTVSKMMDGLVADGLVTRDASSSDRRKVLLTLTSQGGALLEKVREGTQARLMEILAPLTSKEQETIAQALTLLQPLFVHPKEKAGKKKKGGKKK
jgi:MarR family transcriptional regulator for hemolysin